MKTAGIVTILFLSFLLVNVYAQDYLENEFKSYRNPDELVTLSAQVSFNQAIELISQVSESSTGKKIVSTVDITDPIGIEIENMPYEKALYILAKMKDITINEKADIVLLKSSKEKKEEELTDDIYASVNAREVNISALFFEMDVNESRQRGIDWKVLFSKKGLDIEGLLGVDPTNQGQDGTGGTGGGGTGTQQQALPEFDIGAKTNFSAGGFYGEATAIFKLFEEENLGEIIASPNVTTRDKQAGRIQVGSDFSIKQRDFAGNIIENFFPTGVIIDVTPYIYNEEGIDYILLDLHVERSSFQSNETTTEIRKTSANTQAILLDGEEVVIGGLFVNEDTKVRRGIPFLKDLPWWVFGLRYIFGSDDTVTRKKELVILLKADLVPTLKERMAGIKNDKNKLEQELLKNRERIKYYQLDQNTTLEEK